MRNKRFVFLTCYKLHLQQSAKPGWQDLMTVSQYCIIQSIQPSWTQIFFLPLTFLFLWIIKIGECVYSKLSNLFALHSNLAGSLSHCSALEYNCFEQCTLPYRKNIIILFIASKPVIVLVQGLWFLLPTSILIQEKCSKTEICFIRE